jgi:inorganic pyrophosphatase
MPCLLNLETFDAETGKLNVIVETPRGSRIKYKYDPGRRLFKVHSLLPMGSTFPFDFGFIPSTLGGDGDPLDVLVLTEEPALGGCLAPCRLLGVIEAEQTLDGKIARNDRLIAVPAESHQHQETLSLRDLGKEMLKEIEHFFASYNEMQGKRFKPIGCRGPRRAHKLIAEGQERFRQQKHGKQKAAAKDGN